jgi:hypothetical protein
MQRRRDTDPPDPSDDDALLARLRAEAARRDPVPPELIEAGRASFDWRRVDAELAELLFDSDEEKKALSGVRGGGGVRSLTFEASSLTVELDVELVATPDRRRIVGQLVPPREARVEIRHKAGVVELDVDESGRFVVEPIPTGRMSLRCRVAAPATTHIETAWVSI